MSAALAAARMCDPIEHTSALAGEADEIQQRFCLEAITDEHTKRISLTRNPPRQVHTDHRQHRPRARHCTQQRWPTHRANSLSGQTTPHRDVLVSYTYNAQDGLATISDGNQNTASFKFFRKYYY